VLIIGVFFWLLGFRQVALLKAKGFCVAWARRSTRDHLWSRPFYAWLRCPGSSAFSSCCKLCWWRPGHMSWWMIQTRADGQTGTSLWRPSGRSCSGCSTTYHNLHHVPWAILLRHPAPVLLIANIFVASIFAKIRLFFSLAKIPCGSRESAGCCLLFSLLGTASPSQSHRYDWPGLKKPRNEGIVPSFWAANLLDIFFITNTYRMLFFACRYNKTH